MFCHSTKMWFVVSAGSFIYEQVFMVIRLILSCFNIFNLWNYTCRNDKIHDSLFYKTPTNVT